MVSEPTAKSGLVYNGSEQTLLQGGEASVEGTFTYDKQTNAGTYNASWTFTPTDTDSYYSLNGIVAGVTIAKVTPTVSVTPSARTGLKYTGGAQALLSGGEANVAGSFSYDTGTNVGTYTANWAFNPTDTTNYNTVTGGGISVSIAKADGYVNIYGVNEGYDGTSKTLVYVYGNTGTMHYKLDSGSWSTTKPTAITKGSYTIYWYMDASDNYNGIESASTRYVSSSIGKSTPTITSYPTAKSGLVYDGNAHVLLEGGNANVSGSFGYGSGTNAGTYNAYWIFYPTDSTNYNTVDGYVSASIAKATPTITQTPYNRGVTYNGSAQYLLTGGSASVSGSFGYDTGTNAGSYTAYWIFYPSDSTNYNNVDGYVSASIAKANQSAPTAYGASVGCGSSASATASGGGEQGSLEWSNGSSRTELGSQSTKARWGGNSNYNASAWSNEVTLTVSMNDQSAPTAYGSTTTYPATATASATGGGGVGSLEWESAQSQSSVGSHSTRARWTGNSCYNASPWSNYATVQMNKASRSITWASSTSDMAVGNTRALSVNISAGSSDGTLVYSSSDTSKASINGSTLTAVGTGTSVITASITGGTNYENASTSFTLTVTGPSFTINVDVVNNTSSTVYYNQLLLMRSGSPISIQPDICKSTLGNTTHVGVYQDVDLSSYASGGSLAINSAQLIVWSEIGCSGKSNAKSVSIDKRTLYNGDTLTITYNG